MKSGRPAEQTAVPRRALSQLTTTAATGALRVRGTPGGTLYLSGGLITYAESPGSPGIGELLTAAGRLSPETWQATLATGRDARRVGQLLLDDGHLTPAELQAYIRTAIEDAALLVLQPTAVPVHFVTGETHWLGEVVAVPAAELSRRTARGQRAGQAVTGRRAAMRGRAARQSTTAGPHRPDSHAATGPLPGDSVGVGVGSVRADAAGEVHRDLGTARDTTTETVTRLPRRRPGARLPGGLRTDAPVHTAPDELLLTRIRSALRALR